MIQDAFWGILIPFLGTSFGAGCVFFLKKISLLELPLRHRGGKTFPASKKKKKIRPCKLSGFYLTTPGGSAIFTL